MEAILISGCWPVKCKRFFFFLQKNGILWHIDKMYFLVEVLKLYKRWVVRAFTIHFALILSWERRGLELSISKRTSFIISGSFPPSSEYRNRTLHFQNRNGNLGKDIMPFGSNPSDNDTYMNLQTHVHKKMGLNHMFICWQKKKGFYQRILLTNINIYTSVCSGICENECVGYVWMNEAVYACVYAL